MREPSSARTPTANAMSVAIGMPHPRENSPPPDTTMNSTAGATMPPSAATAGSSAARGSRSSPMTSSRLISNPIRKKKIAMRPSLTQW
jgi:hypothetical protein